MVQRNLGVSTNNIPISDKKEYNIQLIRSVNRFINRVRWKIFFLFDPKAKGTRKKETFGLKSQNAAPRSDKYLKEDHLISKCLHSCSFRSRLNPSMVRYHTPP